jgi:hypothetical protein
LRNWSESKALPVLGGEAKKNEAKKKGVAQCTSLRKWSAFNMLAVLCGGRRSSNL